MSNFLSDLRYGVRMILKRPGTSALAILALSLGVGLTTLMFSIIDAAFLRGLPLPEANRIVAVTRRPAGTENNQRMPLADFTDFRAAQRSFEDLAAYDGTGVSLTDEKGAERYSAAAITPNALRLLRAAPQLGRDFNDADSQPGAPAVALIGADVWANQFERSPGVINRVVRMNGVPTTIVGVMPAKFAFPQTASVWLPKTIALPAKRVDGPYVDVFGRLRPGVSMTTASAEVVAIASRLEQQYPENKQMSAAVLPFVRRFLGKDVVNTLSAMLGAVFGVMLIACANVMSLQLARAAERTREVAVRTALGASRLRIVRQMLIEGLVLSLAGAALGLGIASVGNMLFNDAIAGTNPPFWIVVRIDRLVLLFVTALTVLAAVTSSLVPALRATKLDLNAVLKDEGRANTGIQMGRFSRGLVVAEVLLSCCLLVVSGLMIRSVIEIGSVKYPFATRDVFFGNVSADAKKYPKDPDVVRLYERLEEKWAAVPGVRRLAFASSAPSQLGGQQVTIEGVAYEKDGDHPNVRSSSVSVGYWEALRIEPLRGRLPTAADTSSAPLVLVVDAGFARKFFPNEDAVGRRLKVSMAADAPWWTIIGVVPDMNVAAATGETTESVYLPFAQSPTRGIAVLAAAHGSPTAITAGLRTGLRDVDEDLALANSNSLEERLWQRSWAFRVFGSLFMSFGFAALILAGAGLYGVMAFSVRRRTQEIGVRMALGADRGRVLRMILWQGMWRVALGIALGLVPAYFLGGAMKALLFRVTQTDALVIGVTVVSLLIAGLAASFVPAHRAASVDPLKALRQD